MALLKFILDKRAAEKKMAALEASFNDKSELFGVVGGRLLSRVQLGFKMGRDPWGNPWKAIKWRAPRVQQEAIKGADGSVTGYRNKRKKDGSLALTKVGRRQLLANRQGGAAVGNPLRDTGRLRNSITYRVDSDGVTVGTNLIYARAHQFGATIRPKNPAKFLRFPGPSGEFIFAKKSVIPARPFLPLRRNSNTVALPPDWSVDVVRAIRAYVMRRVKLAEQLQKA